MPYATTWYHELEQIKTLEIKRPQISCPNL